MSLSKVGVPHPRCKKGKVKEVSDIDFFFFFLALWSLTNIFSFTPLVTNQLFVFIFFRAIILKFRLKCFMKTKQFFPVTCEIRPGVCLPPQRRGLSELLTLTLLNKHAFFKFFFLTSDMVWITFIHGMGSWSVTIFFNYWFSPTLGRKIRNIIFSKTT